MHIRFFGCSVVMVVVFSSGTRLVRGRGVFFVILELNSTRIHGNGFSHRCETCVVPPLIKRPGLLSTAVLGIHEVGPALAVRIHALTFGAFFQRRLNDGPILRGRFQFHRFFCHTLSSMVFLFMRQRFRPIRRRLRWWQRRFRGWHRRRRLWLRLRMLWIWRFRWNRLHLVRRLRRRRVAVFATE